MFGTARINRGISFNDAQAPKRITMRHLLLIATAGLLVAADAKDDAAKKDLDKFQGTWMLVSGEKDGQKLAADDVKKSKLTWKGKECAVDTPHQAKETIKATAKLDATKTPKEMDWERSAGPAAGKPMHAIYEFTGDYQYRICFAPAGKDRPKEFATKAGSGEILHVWKRVKE
jgi:uncharacterized protein (TIGR03067 family)